MSNTSHRKAWLEIARLYLIPREERTSSQRYITQFGLCDATNLQYGGLHGCHPLTGRGKYGSRIFWWPLTPKNDQYRSLSAMLIAHMGEEEFRMLREEGHE